MSTPLGFPPICRRRTVRVVCWRYFDEIDAAVPLYSVLEAGNCDSIAVDVHKVQAGETADDALHFTSGPPASFWRTG